MIVANGLLYFVSHVPEFVLTLALIVRKKEMAQFCFYNFSCSRMLELAQTLNFVSLSLNGLVYYFFDRHFAESMQTLFGRRSSNEHVFHVGGEVVGLSVR